MQARLELMGNKHVAADCILQGVAAGFNLRNLSTLLS
jgi:hypothetical protein